MSQIAKYKKTTPTRIQFQPAPAGTHIGVIVAVDEEFGVVRPKYENPAESETVDLTTIIIALKDPSGALHFVATAPMRTSADSKSTLVGFIRGVLGSTPWLTDENWDTQKLVGVHVQITLALQQAQKSKRVYSKITNVAPAMAQFAGYAPDLSEAGAALRSYRQAAAQQGPPRVIAPPGPSLGAPVWPNVATPPNIRPTHGTTVPVIQPPAMTIPQTGAAPAAAWPLNPASFAPPVFSGNPLLPAMGGQAAPGTPPTTPMMPPAPPAAPTTPPLTGQPGNAPFAPTAENPDVKF